MNNNSNSIKLQRKGSNSSFFRSRAISTDSIDLNAASKGQDGRPQTHWASSDVNVPINYGDNALLHSIELQEEAEENILATRKRTGSVAHELRSACAGRRMTVESMENANFTEEGSKSKLRSIIDFLDALIPKLHDRVNMYSAGFCLLCLLAASRYLNHTASWFALFFSVVGIDLLTAILDKFLFLYFIDKIFVDHYDIAYLLHGFHGPLGLLFAVFCMGSMLGDIQATKSFPTNWDRFLSAMTFIILCLCGKNWYIRKQYISLLEKRFSDKLFTLETWSILLSMLSTTKPPKDPSNRILIDSKIPKEKPTFDSEEDDLSKVQNFHPQTINEDIDKMIKPHPHPHYPHLGHFDAHFPNINMHKVQKPLKDMQKKVINVFADLVQATSVYNDDFVDDIDVDIKNPIHSPSKGSQTSTPASSTVHRKEDTINAALKQKIKKRKTFWELAARVSSNMGALNVMTYNGAVAIRRKFQAKDFGKNLYDHLSRGNKYLITHRTLETILHETTEHLYDEEMGNKKNNNYSALRMLSDEKKLDSSTFLLECAIDLFDPLRLGYITEEQCVAALCLVYKQQRFAATSLNGYGELHHSLRGVIDFVFWTVMGVIMQAFIQLDVFSYILPFVTILLTMSFALSSLLGNIFLAITFVFFMIPYEVGNKIFIGTDQNTRIAGFVQSVSLLHTTINTLKNELVSYIFPL